jgi:uncharacterized protein YPO0396
MMSWYVSKKWWMGMLSLFTTQPESAGFRLHTFEVYNWGTFDGAIWRMAPGGETSLLTGANASGKTTLVDGLLTLLVPEKRMRYYNQTAGSKGERTEESYVIGEFGDSENEETNVKETRKLRPDKSQAQSILLAVFKNEDRYITLAQCRWFVSGELRRSFVLAHRNLSIDQDFAHFDSAGEWKKRLKQKYPASAGRELITIGDSPTDYGRLMRKAFGMRSAKAHTLFSQTIGLKVLGNLDEFVRQQMLEESDTEAEFQKIKDQFKTLSDAHTAIEKANEQIHFLSPIRDKSIELSMMKLDLDKLEKDREILPLCFAFKRDNLLTALIGEIKADIERHDEKVADVNAEIERLSMEERDIDMQIRQDKVGTRISDLQSENKKHQEQKKDREETLTGYNKLALELNLTENPSDERTFEEQKTNARKMQQTAEELVSQLNNDIFSLKTEKIKIGDELDGVANELNVLRTQKNNITGRTAEIRRQLLEHLDLSETELPFVGELLQVKADEQHWEAATEKLLHNFALRILVPDQYYHRVNRYVNAHDLRGRIVYQRIRNESYLNDFISSEQALLYNKLQFKKSPFTDWVKNEIQRSYDYFCTDNTDEFDHSPRAVTSAGLIKNNNRHEKDDRPEAKGRQQYVLGWDNKEKISVLKEEAYRLDHLLKEKDQHLKILERQSKRAENESRMVIQFLEIKQFKRIDWWSISRKIQDNLNSIEELEKTNHKIKQLKQQHDALLKQISLCKEEQKQAQKAALEATAEFNHKQIELTQNSETLDKYEGLDVKSQLADFDSSYLQQDVDDLHNLNNLERTISGRLNKNASDAKDKIRLLKTQAEVLIRKFKYPSDDLLLKKFPDWKSDTLRLSDSADFLDEYVTLLENIENEELAAHKEKFKKYLNEEMITQMSDFKSWLDRQKEDIVENIETLNKSLEKISFRTHPATFICLNADEDYAPKIKEIRFRLNDWKPDIAEYQRTKDEGILEESFRKIKALLDDLTLDENARKECLDVRNWLKFKAVELLKEDRKKVYRSYTGTAKLSGGEGAQLTYTILGSAIAYQFGIHSEGLNPNSFRFICVDEAFSKQDDEKARFLMDLCKQLHLQLMVVSPAKAEEVAIVEPYIARVHFVYRENSRHSELLDMPMFEFKEGRAKFLDTNRNDQ